MLAENPPRAGGRITLQLPVPGAERPLSLRARVVRVSAAPEVDEQHTVAFAFDEHDHGDELQRLLRHYESGPAQVATEFESDGEGEAEAGGEGPERRKHERVVFKHEVIGLSEEASTVLVGRDLSIGGMRVEGNAKLELGMRLRLAVFGAPGEEPILVRAEVTRADDGTHGLRFVDVGANAASRLERLVAHLPSVEPLDLDEAEGLGAVVTRIVGRD
jgi:hypothetical protein